MQGSPLESTKNAISVALSKLSPEDSFNIIAFSNETFLFSTSMELASKEAIERATEWISTKYSVGGGTNMFIPLEKVCTHHLCFWLNFSWFLYWFKRLEHG